MGTMSVLTVSLMLLVVVYVLTLLGFGGYPLSGWGPLGGLRNGRVLCFGLAVLQLDTRRKFLRQLVGCAWKKDASCTVAVGGRSRVRECCVRGHIGPVCEGMLTFWGKSFLKI